MSPKPNNRFITANSKVFVLTPEQVEAKVKELAAEGYCVGQPRNFLVVGTKVILFADSSDLSDPEDGAETASNLSKSLRGVN